MNSKHPHRNKKSGSCFNRICIYGVLLVSFLHHSCSNSIKLEQALEFAGTNRPELEKVLTHYKADKNSLKFKATEFLIQNMPYHKTDEFIAMNEAYDGYFARVDSLYSIIFGDLNPTEIMALQTSEYDSIRRAFAAEFMEIPQPEKVKGEHDINTIGADYLVKHIDSAFEEWENNPLLKDVSFDDFLEFILPYRTTEEPLIFDSGTLKKIFKKELGKDGFVPIQNPVGRYKVYLNKLRWINNYIETKFQIGVYDLMQPKLVNDCYNLTTWTCNVFRSSGIPVVFEYTPQYRDRESKHFWCASPDSTGIVLPYTVPENNLMEDWENALRYGGKVYRKAYAANPDAPFFISSKDEYIAPALSSATMLDVTWRYKQTVTFSMPFAKDTPNNVAYLCFFTRNGFSPVAWGNIDKKAKRIIFKQVPVNTLFFPAFYVGNSLKQFSDPFVLIANEKEIDIPLPHTRKEQYKELTVTLENRANKPKGGVAYYPVRCIKDKRVTMKLIRKFPEKRDLKRWQQAMVGGCFTASNQLDGKFDTLYMLKDTPPPYLQEIKLDNSKKYRYYRYEAPTTYRRVNIAHMEFLGQYSSKHLCKPPTGLPVYSKKASEEGDDILYSIVGTPLKRGNNPQDAFDGNWETFVTNSFVGMDFAYPVHISHVRFVPRNANNMIVKGDQYELMYYDNGWHSVATQIAESEVLTFENVFANTLYWLRNLSKGKEELPFFYTDADGQIFIHEETVLLKNWKSNYY